MSTFVIDRMVKYPLVKNVHRHQIGVINNDGDFEPKIFFNFSFTHYVHCSEKKIQVSFLIQFIYYVFFYLDVDLPKLHIYNAQLNIHTKHIL